MGPTPPDIQRRRHPRIEIDGTVTAQDLTAGSVVVIRDLSTGGFRTESPRAAVIGRVHLFRVRLPRGTTCLLQAAAVHCQATANTRHTTLIGWRAESDPTTVDGMRRLIEALTTLDPSLTTDTDTAADTNRPETAASHSEPVRSLRWPRG